MNYVEIPYLPGREVKVVLVDGRMDREIEKGLLQRGIRVVKTRRHSGLDEAVAYHPDLMLTPLGNRKMVFAPGTHLELLKELEELGFELLEGKTNLTSRYPGNIAYNVARVGNFAIHNFRYTDPVVKNFLENEGVEMIHVRQGYSKCSVSVIDSQTLITSDAGIASAAEKRGLEVLLIPPEKSILLPGLSYGFLGGSTGLLSNLHWAIAGDVRKLQSSEVIQSFFIQKKMKIVSLSEGVVKDLGSIIPLLTAETVSDGRLHPEKAKNVEGEVWKRAGGNRFFSKKH